MKNKKKINLGIVGKNFGYNVIYKSFKNNRDFKILAFAFKSKRYDKKKIPTIIRVYNNWKKLILNKSIDAIAIASPPIMHKKIIKFAVKHNKHIFCEKPLTCSLKESNEICKLIKKKKNISNMVNYEFAEIDAFRFFKQQILNKKINISKIDLKWYLNYQSRNNGWKRNYDKGGSIIFHNVCHAIYYLEFFFGKIVATKTDIFINKKVINCLKSVICFDSGLSARINIRAGTKNFGKRGFHQLKIESKKNDYILKSNVNTHSDKFEVIKINKLATKHLIKKEFIFKNKKDKADFKIKPTFNNSKKFSSWILKGETKKPNFLDAQRIHLIIEKMVCSSKEKKKIYIN